MAGRKLNKQQTRRVKARREQLIEGPTEEGRVISHRGQRVVIMDSAGEEITCFQRANLQLVTGDRVSWSRAEQLAATPTEDGAASETASLNNKGHVVTAMHPRSSLLSRPDAYGKLRPVAANVEQMCLVLAAEPEPHRNLIDRYLVAANASGLEVLFVHNKCELEFEALADMLSDYLALGYPMVSVSAAQGTNIDGLVANCANKTSILVGQSGVGKSSLINALLPASDAAVGALSAGQVKGRHTTSKSTLYALREGGWLVDSPGIREFGLSHVDAQDVERGFIEFNEFLGHCRFRNCTHQVSEAGCALESAVDAGEIKAERLESFRRIVNDVGD